VFGGVVLCDFCDAFNRFKLPEIKPVKSTSSHARDKKRKRYKNSEALPTTKDEK
jgi:hypothetical protein